MAARKPLVLTAGQIERLPDGDFIELGKLNIGAAESINVISDTITVTKTHVEVASLVNQDVIQINGGEDNDLLLIRGALVTARVRFKSTGNLVLTKNRNVEGIPDILVLLKLGSLWYEVSWSDP